MAEIFAVKGADAIIQRVLESLAGWEAAARVRDVPVSVISAIGQALAERREEVLGR